MIAYNMGPGATDKWLSAGADMRKLPKETRQYIQGVSLAGGGEIRHYAGTTDGSLVENDEPTSAFERFFNQDAYLKDYQDKLAKQREFEKVTREQPGMFEKTTKAQRDKAASSLATATQARSGAKTVAPEQQKASPAEVEQFMGQYTNPPVVNNIPQNAAGIVNLKQDQADKEFSMMDYIKAREAKMDKAAEKDLALAGLAAGLGMLGGTSQYAFENIGKGGQMGVQQLAQSQKTRAAQEAAMGTLYGAASKLNVMEKLRRDQLAQGKELKEDKMSQDLLTAKNAFIQKRLKERGMDEMILGTLKRQQAMGKLDPAKLPELNYYEQQMRNIETEANRMFASPNTGSGMRIVGVRG
jgi:hypothetical protein